MSVWSYISIVAMFKIPALAFAWLVWRAMRTSDDPHPQTATDGDGGSKLRLDPHPRPRVPRRPRRDPHGAAPVAPPARVRLVNARACVVGR